MTTAKPQPLTFNSSSQTSCVEFAELNAISWFSFLRSAASPEQLVTVANNLGYQAIAITDECSLAGVVRAWQQAQTLSIKLIVGATFTTTEAISLTLLVKDKLGYQQLSRAISHARCQRKGKNYQISIAELVSCDHCLILWRPTIEKPASWPEQLKQLHQSGWNSHYVLLTDQLDAAALNLPQLRRFIIEQHLQPVASCWPRMLHRQQKGTIDLIDAIQANTPLAQMGTRLSPNAERRLQNITQLKNRYSRIERQNTLHIAQQCCFNLAEIRYQYPDDHRPQGMSADEYLQTLTTAGIKKRFPNGLPKRHQQQLAHELTLIAELQYANYFLTIYDIVQFAQREGILYQGRGSAANSIVCYLLEITAVNPDQVDLLFERFISKERSEPPDIDVDFEHQRREEVIQYIYQTYGRDRTALTATVISYRIKSALRDAGKALSLPQAIIDTLAHQPDWRDHSLSLETQIRNCNLLTEFAGQQLAQAVNGLLGMPRHLSQHVGGFVIAKDQLIDLVPIETASMEGRTIIQWDKDDLETLGLMKVDILALGMLSAIQRTFELLQQSSPNAPTQMHQVPLGDQDVYAMLSRADSIGVFQVESRAQMNMLPRLKPHCYYDLVIEVAIVRPGPIQGEMVHPYLLRRHGKEAFNYPDQAIEQVLKRTLGVPIFQEQVIRLAMVAAGFSAGEADQLRRAITGWKRHPDLAPFEAKLRSGLAKRGYPESFAERMIQQIHGFGGYGFPESHAASFALLVYISAWLKYHHPGEFCCALLNSQPMGFYSPAQLIQDARRHGVTVLPVDIAHSQWQHTMEDGALRLGLSMVANLQKKATLAFLAKREQNSASATQLAHYFDQQNREALAAAGALDPQYGHRYQAFWEVGNIAPPLPLFADLPNESQLKLHSPSEYHNIIADYQTTGVSLRRHPLALLREQNALTGSQSSADLPSRHQGELIRVSGLVINRQRPCSAGDVTFLTLEDEFGSINVIVWSATAKAQRKVLINARLLTVYGIIEREEKIIHVIAGRLIDDTPKLQSLPVRSRDFR